MEKFLGWLLWGGVVIGAFASDNVVIMAAAAAASVIGFVGLFIWSEYRE